MRNAIVLSSLTFLIAAAPPAGQTVAGSPIRHVIVIVQENRSFDNLFASSILAGGGPYPGANTSQTTTVDGKPLHLRPIPFAYPADPSHSHPSLLKEWDGGKMDGFGNDYVTVVKGYPSPPPDFPYAFLPQSDTALYHVLAGRYALADMNFAPRLVPTFPSHYTLATTQSYVAGNPAGGAWGCDAKPGTTAAVFGEGETIAPNGVFPCFDQTTIADLLDAARVDWKYYTGGYNQLVNATVNIYDAFRKIRYGPDWTRNVITPSAQILSDIDNCNLSSVSFVMPDWLMSDHAGNLSSGGPGWVGSIYDAVVQSQTSPPSCNYYKDTAIILTWDDSGGWYDRVAPPKGPDGTSWGFRIPIVVMSAWAKSNYDPSNPHATPYVSHTIRESTAITTFIEKNWALGNMGQRDVTDDDLHDMFDYTRAQPVPPFWELSLHRMIERTHFNVAVAERDDHVVDDDR